jgi:hypothetical protein
MLERSQRGIIGKQGGYGYVWDMWGRLLHCAAVRSILPWVVSRALREMGNFPYQSGEQRTIKLTIAEPHDTSEQGTLRSHKASAPDGFFHYCLYRFLSFVV